MDFPTLYPTFPLTKSVYQRNNLSSPFQYLQIESARVLLYKERISGTFNPSFPLYASDLSGIGLIGKAQLYLLYRYFATISPTPLSGLEDKLRDETPDQKIQDFLHLFLATYPIPDSVSLPPQPQLLSPSTNGISNQLLIVYLSTLLVHLVHENSAIAPYHPLFLSSDIINHPSLKTAIDAIENLFSYGTSPSGSGENLIAFLKKPSLLHPSSLSAQLNYILEQWKPFLPENLFRELSRGIDYIKEERAHRGLLPGQKPVVQPPFPDHKKPDPDEERFSQDEDWMSNAVLIAKNIYVWLDQLSKKYQREIDTLASIPQSELDDLSRRGINCLWLIGIWERSSASREIKRRCGNPEAIPSAYSIYDYVIADDLGGEEALNQLQDSATRAGLRLAADMVPNHMGIYSKWILEHPERFLSLDNKPFPSYSYTGPDLSPSEKISIYLEDHYYQQTDAAVVFKRVDHTSGDTSFIYHGNDGTAMPWNDTAQLNFLRRDVREAIISTILKVADRFSVIRFDAAMTLAKKHFQRLWFPPPGEGGAIPTRAEHGMTRKEFDEAFPVEFWRQVVDRVSAEHPDTLLIAEAFWMMEGYFVKTLGMHRVYNSAFMHMLRDENNAKYRDLIRKTLLYDPGILKRFVNFMNNPDEDTAVAQFGKGGKYFGVCTLMCTLPGTPMFGHGQIEGYHEKYGMEYQKAYYDESPDPDLVEKHQHKIFPLLKKRPIFSHADHFVLYDFITGDNKVDENVFAYSNRHGGQSALVVYHNKWGETEGKILYSSIDPEQRLGPSLSLHANNDLQEKFITFKDMISGMEYLLPCRKFFEEGIPLSLGAYECHVFHDFQQVKDTPHKEYQALYTEIDGFGVPNLEDKLHEVRYRDSSSLWLEIIHILESFGENEGRNEVRLPLPKFSQGTKLHSKLNSLYAKILSKSNISDPDLSPTFPQKLSRECLSYLKFFTRQVYATFPIHASSVSLSVHYSLLMWATLSPLVATVPLSEMQALKGALIRTIHQEINFSNNEFQGLHLALDIFLDSQQGQRINRPASPLQTVQDWFDSGAVRNFIGVHTYQGTRYYHKESFQDFIYLYFSISLAVHVVDNNQHPSDTISMLADKLHTILSAANQSDYRPDKLIDKLDQHSS